MWKRRTLSLTSLLAIVMFLILISCAYGEVGTGTLFVYMDTWGGVEAPKSGPKETYMVLTGFTYYIRLVNITEFDTGELLTIKIGWTDVNGTARTTFFVDVPVNEKPDGTRYVDVPAWVVPSDAKVCTTCTVHYTRSGDPDYVARGQVSTIGHLHVIPETFLGTIGSMLVCFAGFGVLLARKRSS